MNNMTEDQYFKLYIIAWLVVALISEIVSRRAKDVKTKRNINIIATIVIAILMGILTSLLGMPIVYISIFLIAGLIIAFINDKYTYYCLKCGAINAEPFKKIEFCPKCGAKYTDSQN